MSDRQFTVARQGLRLDRALADLAGCGRRQARALIASGRLTVDGRYPAPGERTRAGSRLCLAAPPAAASPAALPVALGVVWRGQGLVAVAKPAGLHSQWGRSPDSVDAFLQATEPGFGGPGSAGVLHRIDRDTSGLVLASCQTGVHQTFRKQFSLGRVEKHYLALVHGRLSGPRLIDIPLARRRSRVVRARRADRVLTARTTVVPLDRGPSWTLVLASMNTGVTHQVRAHLALAGHPLIGDSKYGGPPAPAGSRRGQLLHALRVRCPGGPDISVAVAGDFTRAYKKLGR